ncbi:MAG: cupin domain-containing protein [Cyanobacteriota bacterium]|nr:cupin domain-containing protein [Cyanobacteriota bacterium]
MQSWPTWGCEVSTFPWSYDEQETCLLPAGDVPVTPAWSPCRSRPGPHRVRPPRRWCATSAGSWLKSSGPSAAAEAV